MTLAGTCLRRTPDSLSVCPTARDKRTRLGACSPTTCVSPVRRGSGEEDEMSSEARQRKLADRIKVIVAETLEKRIKDPQIGRAHV